VSEAVESTPICRTSERQEFAEAEGEEQEVVGCGEKHRLSLRDASRSVGLFAARLGQDITAYYIYSVYGARIEQDLSNPPSGASPHHHHHHYHHLAPPSSLRFTPVCLC
jgi:hypothetical protein